MITVSDISGDKRILIGNDYCGRAASVLLDHSWTRARIAIRLCMDDSGADVNPANFYVGLSTGPGLFQTPAVPPNPAHAAMFRLTGFGATWFRNPAPGPAPVRYYRQSTVGELYVNGVQTTGSAGNIESGTHYIGATDLRRTLLFCDFIKGSPNWTMDYFRNSDPQQVDVSQGDFETNSLILSPAVANYSWGGGGGGSTMAVDEATNGYFTHVNIAWNNAAPLIKISDLRVITF